MSTAGRHRAPNAGAAAPTVGQPGISCSSLSRKFGEIYAVRDLTFEAPMGAVTGFVGANGAGKTTLMRMIAGIMMTVRTVFDVDNRDGAVLPHVRACRYAELQPAE